MKCHSLGFADWANVHFPANVAKSKPRPRSTLHTGNIEQTDIVKGALYWGLGPDLGLDFMGSLKLVKKCQVYVRWGRVCGGLGKFPYTM